MNEAIAHLNLSYTKNAERPLLHQRGQLARVACACPYWACPGVTLTNLLAMFGRFGTFATASTLPCRVPTTVSAMTTRAKSATAEEIAAIEELIGDLEKRLRRLSTGASREISGASGEVGDFVNEALQRIMNRVRDSASEAGKSLADEATKLGSGAFKKLTDEVEERPLLMLAAAAGIGFLAGLANRR